MAKGYKEIKILQKNHKTSNREFEKKQVYFAKDNFWTKDFFTTASSFFLSDFNPGNDATVIKLLRSKKFVCLGKTDLDEFALGASGLLSSNGILTNPHNSQHITGGSSSGSAVVVAKGLATFSLGSDTGGSVRCPASYCGIVGFKPSNGLISRHGLIPLSSSLDTVGILATKVEVVKNIFSIISKKDYSDLLTISSRKKKQKKILSNSIRKIAIIAGLEKHLDKKVRELYFQTLLFLKKESYIIEEITLPKKFRENLQLAYLIISCSELLSHLNSLQGITYGRKEKKTINEKRNKYFGKETKKRLLLGAYFLENIELLEQARKLRYSINNWIKKLFASYNFLIFPSMNNAAPKIKEISPSFAGSQITHWINNLLILANFAGNPSLSLPIGKINGLPIGINIDSDYGKDKEILEIAEVMEKIINFE